VYRQGEDDRQDMVALGKLKHGARYAFVKYRRASLATFFKLGMKRDRMLICFELLAQVLIPANLTLITDEDTNYRRMTHSATHFHGCNISKEVYLNNHYIVTNTTLVAHAMWREMKWLRRHHLFPRSPPV